MGEEFFANFNCAFLDVCPITIGYDVWIGGGVIILAGVSLANNVVVVAGVVVSMSFSEDNIVLAANLSKIIKRIDY